MPHHPNSTLCIMSNVCPKHVPAARGGCRGQTLEPCSPDQSPLDLRPDGAVRDSSTRARAFLLRSVFRVICLASVFEQRWPQLGKLGSISAAGKLCSGSSGDGLWLGGPRHPRAARRAPSVARPPPMCQRMPSDWQRFFFRALRRRRAPHGSRMGGFLRREESPSRLPCGDETQRFVKDRLVSTSQGLAATAPGSPPPPERPRSPQLGPVAPWYAGVLTGRSARAPARRAPDRQGRGARPRTAWARWRPR